MEEVPRLGVQLAHPAAVVLGPDVVDDDAAVGVGEAEEHDPAVLVRRPRVGEAVGDSVGGGPQAVVERLVRVAHQRRVRVGVLHQRRGRRQLQRGWNATKTGIVNSEVGLISRMRMSDHMDGMTYSRFR